MLVDLVNGQIDLQQEAQGLATEISDPWLPRASQSQNHILESNDARDMFESTKSSILSYNTILVSTRHIFHTPRSTFINLELLPSIDFSTQSLDHEQTNHAHRRRRRGRRRLSIPQDECPGQPYWVIINQSSVGILLSTLMN